MLTDGATGWLIKSAWLILLTLTVASTGFAQEESSGAEGIERGLVLNQTTPEQAISFLGTAKVDQIGRLKVQTIERWVTPRRNEKIFRQLSFEKAKGLKRIDLSFLDGKLVLIHFRLDKKIPAKNLPLIYGKLFLPVVNNLARDLRVSDYEKYKGHVEVASFPRTYYLIAATKSSFISARVLNSDTEPEIAAGGVITPRSSTREIRTTASRLVGEVMEIQLISRELENK